MGILTKRNAVVGWAAWRLGKRAARRKAKAAVPHIDEKTGRPNKPAILSALAAIGGAVWGALWFWRRRKGDDAESGA